VTNFTPHFNVAVDGANAFPFAGGGTYILDLPENWKPWGDSARRVYHFDVEPYQGAMAARMQWIAAKAEYRRRDGSRGTCRLYRAHVPPEQMPAGSFCQDPTRPGVFVRMPADAAAPCPIGTHQALPPSEAIGYYVGRGNYGKGPAEKYLGRVIDAELAARLEKQGVKELDVVANRLSCMGGSATLEAGGPILGLCKDADGRCRPGNSRQMRPFGTHRGPGRFDVGAWEHGTFVP